MRDDVKNEYGIVDLQDKILEIMVYIDEFCNFYGIDYCLMAGSALGARRHGGFIPWDDDIDIYMTEKDYNLFRKKFFAEGDKKKYYLQEWGKIDDDGCRMITIAKLRMNGTTINEKAFQDWRIHKGIFVDIFILHNCPENKFLQCKQYIWSEAAILKCLELKKYNSKNIKDKILLSLIKLFPSKWIIKKGLRSAYSYNDIDTKFVHGFIDTRNYSRAIFPKEIMFPFKYTNFEKVKLKVPSNIDEYLRIQFGNDYMTPPAYEKRQINKHIVSWKIDNKMDNVDYSDEKKLF